MTYNFRYTNDAKISGIIYFYRISDTRLLPSLRDLTELAPLCEEEVISKVALVTTMWERGTRGNYIQREEELKEVHWREMVKKGSGVLRFNDTFKSAWDIIDAIAPPKINILNPKFTSYETAELRTLSETLRVEEITTLEQTFERQKKVTRELRNTVDPSLSLRLTTEYRDLDNTLHEAFEALGVIEIPLWRRLLLYLTTNKLHQVIDTFHRKTKYLMTPP